MSQILLYQSEDGRTKLDVRLENETLWLNQKQLTELFGKAKGTISEHIKHLFEDGELEEISVVRLFRTTATDGMRERFPQRPLNPMPEQCFRSFANGRTPCWNPTSTTR